MRTIHPTLIQVREAKELYKSRPAQVEHFARTSGHKCPIQALMRGEFLTMSVAVAEVLGLTATQRGQAECTVTWNDRVRRLIREVDEGR